MSLHCPARLLLVSPERLVDLAPALVAERLAAVYAPRTPEGARAVAEAGRLLDLPGHTLADLVTAASAREAVGTIADLHRGENVLLLAGPDLVSELTAHALGRPAGDGWSVLECGDDGWRLTPGR